MNNLLIICVPFDANKLEIGLTQQFKSTMKLYSVEVVKVRNALECHIVSCEQESFKIAFKNVDGEQRICQIVNKLFHMARTRKRSEHIG